MNTEFSAATTADFLMFKVVSFLKKSFIMGPLGLEPRTYGLKVRYSTD